MLDTFLLEQFLSSTKDDIFNICKSMKVEVTVLSAAFIIIIGFLFIIWNVALSLLAWAITDNTVHQ